MFSASKLHPQAALGKISFYLVAFYYYLKLVFFSFLFFWVISEGHGCIWSCVQAKAK